MPQMKNLTVQVTNRDGNKLDEWGVHHLRGQNKISAYIKSCNDMAFQVTVKPNIPFVDPDAITFNKDFEMDVGLTVFHNSYSNMEYSKSINIRSLNHLLASVEASKASVTIPEDQRQGLGNRANLSNGNGSFSLHSYNSSKSKSQSPPPFHLLASLYLDGRQTPEQRLIIYLDPDHEDFTLPDGKVKFKRRCVQAKDGTTKELSWVFREVEVEKVFGKMSIEGVHDEVRHSSDQGENMMVALMSSAGLGAERDFQQERTRNAGQIQVVLQRVVLGNKWHDKHYKPTFREDEMEDVNVEGVKNDITHTAGFEYTSTLPARPTGVVNFRPYVEGEAPYASFHFFYRNQGVLEKFNFPGFPRSAKSKTRRQLNDELCNLTPLSIVHPVQTFKQKGISFEQRVQENPSSPSLELKHKFQGGDHEAETFDKSKSTSRQQEHLSSDSKLLPAVKESAFNALSVSPKYSQRDIPHKAFPISLETPIKISTDEKSVDATQSSSIPTIKSRAIQDINVLAPNNIPKIHRKSNQERGSENDLGSGDDENTFSQKDNDFLIQDLDDCGLHTELGQIAISKKRHVSDEDFEGDSEDDEEENSSTKAAAGSPVAESSVAVFKSDVIKKEFAGFVGNSIENISFKEQAILKAAPLIPTAKASKRMKRNFEWVYKDMPSSI